MCGALLCFAMATTVVCAWARSVNSVIHHNDQVQHSNLHHLNRTETSPLLHKKTHSNIHNISTTDHKKRKHSRKKSTWSLITNTLTQMVLGNNDDYDDDSSSSSSKDRSKSDSESEEHTKRSVRKRIMNKNTPGYRLGQWFQITTVKPLRAEKAENPAVDNARAVVSENKLSMAEDKVDGKMVVKEEVGMEVAKGAKEIPKNELMYKMAGKGEVQHNLFHSLSELKRNILVSGKMLPFVEYASFLEIVALDFIAARVFRTPYLSVPVRVLANLERNPGYHFLEGTKLKRIM